MLAVAKLSVTCEAKFERFICRVLYMGRSRRRREDNIIIDLKEIGLNMRNWVDSAQDRDYWRTLVNAALNVRVP